AASSPELPTVAELADTTISLVPLENGKVKCSAIALALTNTLTASAPLRTQCQSLSRSVRRIRKKSTRCSQAHTPPIRSKSPNKLWSRAGEKRAERNAAARNATRDQKIGSARSSSGFPTTESATTSAVMAISTTTRKKRLRGSTI